MHSQADMPLKRRDGGAKRLNGKAKFIETKPVPRLKEAAI